MIAPELPGLRQVEDQVREAHRSPLVAGRPAHQPASRTSLRFRLGLNRRWLQRSAPAAEGVRS
jgi:hypothetical protein